MRRAAALLVGIALVAARLPAQQLLPTTPRFLDIVHLAQDGYGDSARVLIARILTRTPRTDSSYAEALFTAGAVARTGDSMHSAYARIVVEYARSPWADKAQLRLAELAYGNGDMNDVVSRVGQLFADYPESPVIATAALWGARAAFANRQLQQGCDWLTKGLARAGDDDLELRNQLLFAKQRCNIGTGVRLAPVNPDSLRQGPPPSGDTVAGRGAAPTRTAGGKTRTSIAAGPWRVQVAAISDKAAIRRLVQKLESAGFKAYAIPGPRNLTKVQAGPFPSRAAAAAQVARLKALAGGSPFVTTAP
ncbi:MAG: SPOR domain-containing protein [Gemmatimonadales bacterium]